jgi:ribosomal protein S25
VITASSTTDALGVQPNTAYLAIDKLVAAGVLREVTGKRRGRIYVYQQYYDILNADL